MARKMKDGGIEWIGQIPAEWKMQRNKICFDCSKELVGEKSVETQLLSLTTKGIKEKKAEESTGKVPETYDTYQIVSPNDIVMCLFDLDVSAVFSGRSSFKGMISPTYKVLKCKTERILPVFAEYWFSYVFDGRKFKHYSKNLRYTLNYDEFAVLPILLPNINEQQRIADFLDTECARIDEVIEKTQASIAEYKKLKQSIITEVVTKGIRKNRPMKDSGIEWIGEIPEDWEIIRIKWLLDERKDKSELGEEEPLSMSQKYGLIPTKNMDTIPNMASTYVGAKIVHKGDLVFNKLKAHLGVFSVSDYEGLVSPDYAVYYNTGRADMKFLEYLFKTPQYIGEFKKKSSGVGAGLMRLYTDELYSIYCALPNMEQQKAIVNYVDKRITEMDKLIVKKEELLEELEKYKRSMIYEYVTGKKEA